MEQKTRNLSAAEYFLVIQKEYLIAEFRRKIHYSPKDKAYYQRVMEHKAEKIKTIAKRNCLDSIFDNEAKLEEVRNELFDESGKPIFDMTQSDIDNYFAPGNEFAYQRKVWTLESVKPDGSLVLFQKNSGEYEIANKKDVCRIL